MPATATARKPQTRTTRASAARRAPRAAATRAAVRPAPRAVGPRLVPVVVGRTAVAVGGMADSGLIGTLTRSRLWIGLLAGLLVGIVGLNVAALQFNASSSKTAALADELKRENSALRAEIAGGLSNERLQAEAELLGLVVPEPRSILNLNPRPGDAAAAAERLRDGQVTFGSAYVPPPAPVAVVDPLATPDTVDPAAAAVTEPTADPAAPETTALAEAAPTTDSGVQAAPTTATGGASIP